MKRHVAVWALALCFLLTACGGRENGGEDRGLLERASGISETETLLTVDGREVPGWRYLYWLTCTCDDIREQYGAEDGEPDWDMALSGGTLADYARDQALADTALYATVENWAEEYGCTVTKEDRAALTAAWTEKMADWGGEAAYLEHLADLGLTKERAWELSEVGYLYGHLYQLSRTADSPLAPTEAEVETYAKTQSALTVDRILVAAGEDREAARQRAAAIFSQLNGAADQAASFAALAAEGDDTAGPRTFRPGDGTLDGTLEAAALTLEEGQCSGILESDEGFSILRRLPADRDALLADCFDARLQAAAEDAAVILAESYGQLDAASFSAALVRERALDR